MKKRKLPSVLRGAMRIYLDVNVSRGAAALSYFLMLSIFPMFICLYEMLGSMFPTKEAIISFASGLIPSEAVDTLVDYLVYVTENHNTAMLTMALAAMATTSAAAFRTLDNMMGEIRGARRFTGAFALIFSFVFSLIFLAAVYFAVIVMVTGNWFFTFLAKHVSFLSVSGSWEWGRFVLLFLLLLVINLGIYRITAPRGPGVRIFTGAAAASAALVGVSILFSFFIGMSSKYPVIYGSLASVMILLFWLYVCGTVVIGGNILNVAIERYEAGEGG